MTDRYVYIYRAAKTAMQSGRAFSEHWFAEFPRVDGSTMSVSSAGWRALPDAVMGWHGGGETREQLCISFSSLSSALAWAKRQDLTPILRPQQVRRAKRKAYAKSYASNFAHGRPVPWTH